MRGLARGNPVGRLLSVTGLATAVVIASFAVAGAATAGSGRTDATNLKIAYLIGGLGNTFITAQLNGAKQVAKAHGVQLDIVAGDWNPATQLNQIQDTTSKGDYDGYLFEVLDGTSTCKPIRQVAAKFPVAIVTAPICGSKPYTKGTVKFSGRVDELDGRTQANLVNQAASGRGEVAIITGHVALTIVKLFTRGFSRQIAKFPNLKIVSSAAGDYDPAKALAAAEDILQAHPNVKIIACQSDNMCDAAYRAVQAAGKTNQIKMVGYGFTKGTKELILEGKMYGTIMLTPKQEAQFALRAVIDTLQGKKVAKRIFLDRQAAIFRGQGNIITKQNVSKYQPQW